MISIGVKTKDKYDYRFMFFELRTHKDYYRLCLFAFCFIRFFLPLFNLSVTDVSTLPEKKKLYYVSICVMFFLGINYIWNPEKKNITDIKFKRILKKGETK